MLNEIYKKVQNEKSQSINLLRDIVNIESFSGSKSNVDTLANFYQKNVKPWGAKINFILKKILVTTLHLTSIQVMKL